MTPFTGEVFRTIGEHTASNYWRLFRGPLEAGRIFSLVTDENFHIHSVVDDLRFGTTAIERARLSQTTTGATVGTYGGLDLSGHFGVGPFNTVQVYTPFSKFHADRSGANDRGFRPGMLEGMSATSGDGFAYFGLLGGSATNDAVLTWSRKNGPSDQGARLRFVYTGDNTLASTASSANGLELGRFQPAVNNNEGFFGVGDWTTAGLLPDHRLDVLNGAIRFRDLPLPAYQGSGLTKYLVVEDAIAGQIGRLKWQTLPPGLCDWNVAGVNSDVVTAYAGNPCPPQDAAFVGIGTNAPTAKLDVYKFINSGTPDKAINIRQVTSAALNTGLFSEVSGPGQMNVGVESFAKYAGRVFGVRGYGQNSSFKVGVYGEAVQQSCTEWAAAIWGYSPVYSQACANGYAGYFQGRVAATSYSTIPSDDALKTNEQALTGSLARVTAMQPKTYEYDLINYGHMGLPPGPQSGLVSQELQLVAPELVIPEVCPPVLDPLGTEIHPAVEYLGINYVGLIPDLIGAIQELKTTADGQQQQIDQLLAIINSCCAANDQDNTLQYMPAGGAGSEGHRNSSKLMVHPNPFTRITTIAVGLDRASQVRITLLGLNGQVHRSLELGEAPEGIFTYELSTDGIAAGQYILTVELDGEAQAAQIVKLNDR